MSLLDEYDLQFSPLSPINQTGSEEMTEQEELEQMKRWRDRFFRDEFPDTDCCGNCYSDADPGL